MINQLFVVGKIIEIDTLENNELMLEVVRNYKNTDGIFEKDLFRCDLWIALSKRIGLNCKNGDVVAVKGRLVEDEGNCHILAEQVILLNKL